jgi:hypothetical protein
MSLKTVAGSHRASAWAVSLEADTVAGGPSTLVPSDRPFARCCLAVGFIDDLRWCRPRDLSLGT